MQPQIIGIKKLYRELKQITEAAGRGKSFTVVKNAKPVFRIEPIIQTRGHKYSLADLETLRFKSGEKNLSKKIDTLVYGV